MQKIISLDFFLLIPLAANYRNFQIRLVGNTSHRMPNRRSFLKKIVDGKFYDTEHSKIVCDISPIQYRYVGKSDFRWDKTYLYRTKNGRFFIAGEGGPLSQWGAPEGNHGFTSGSGLKPIQELEARRLTEEFADTETYVSVFGEPEAA